MIEYIDSMFCEWGRQHRRMLYGNPNGHVDGWSTISIQGKIFEQWEGASQAGKVEQRVFEVYHGDGLEIQRALYLPQVVKFKHWAAAQVHYVMVAGFLFGGKAVSLPAKQKATILSRMLKLPDELGVNDYYARLHALHELVDDRLVRLEGQLRQTLKPSLKTLVRTKKASDHTE